jgi:hypothetical protein
LARGRYEAGHERSKYIASDGSLHEFVNSKTLRRLEGWPMEIREVMGGGADPAVVAHSGPQRNNGAWRALAWTAALGVDVAMLGTAFLTPTYF